MAVTVLVAAALPRLWAAIQDQSVFHPDEIYQSLEQAHRFAFGYGLIPWEFRDGARSWAYPGALGLLWKIMTWLGVRSAATLVIAAKMLMALASVTAIGLSMRLAHRLAGWPASIFAGALGAALPTSIVFAHRSLTETASGPLVVAAVLLAVGAGGWRLFAAGAVSALAALVRYQNGIVLVVLLAFLLLRRRREEALSFALGSLGVGLAGAALDWATWGSPLHSVIVYTRFNLLSGGASRTFGTSPFHFYAVFLWRSTGPALIVVVACFAIGVRRAVLPALCALSYLLAHTLVPHKELRFLMPAMPLLLTVSGVGLATAHQRWQGGWRTWGLLLVVIALLAYETRRARYGDFGEGIGWRRAKASVWSGSGVNEVLWEAGERVDLCGVAVVQIPAGLTGGYSYLHRNVPILFLGAPPPAALESANYLVAGIWQRTKIPRDHRVVARARDALLFRREGPCAPPPDFRPVFPGADDMGLWPTSRARRHPNPAHSLRR